MITGMKVERATVLEKVTESEDKTISVQGIKQKYKTFVRMLPIPTQVTPGQIALTFTLFFSSQKRELGKSRS